MALSHTIGGVEGAYARGQMLERRRAMMQDWSTYCDKVQRRVLSIPD
jgi:hypothetical protein